MANRNNQTDDDAFYVGIGEPKELRREVLESSKLMIEILQSERKVERLRAEKALLITRLKKIVREINLIVGKIKKRLPRTKLRAIAKERQLEVYKNSLSKDSKTVKKQKVTKKKTPAKKAEKKSDYDKLQAQLDDIEAKLRSI